MESRGLVAVIDEKFCGSTYCNNELVMAQGNGLQLFPLLFRGLSFESMPSGLRYMLASTNVLPFPEAAGDEATMQKLQAQMHTTLGSDPAKMSMRHGASREQTQDECQESHSYEPKLPRSMLGCTFNQLCLNCRFKLHLHT